MGQLAGIARRENTRAAMETLDAADLTEQSGVANDSRGRPGKRQVTVMSADVWQTVCEEVGSDLPWTSRRANLLVEGVELPQRSGDIIVIGTVRLLVMMETNPCSRMEEACPGLRKILEPNWRGGVCCKVLNGGPVAIGDSVSVENDPSN